MDRRRPDRRGGRFRIAERWRRPRPAGRQPVIEGNGAELGHGAGPAAARQPAGAAGELKAVANVRARCQALVEKVEALIERADSDEDISWRERAALIVAAKQILELLGRLTGEIGPVAEAVIVESPRWKRIEAKIAEALATFPEAAAAVAKALQEIDAA